jgi:hypothetical protein
MLIIESVPQIFVDVGFPGPLPLAVLLCRQHLQEHFQGLSFRSLGIFDSCLYVRWGVPNSDRVWDQRSSFGPVIMAGETMKPVRLP